MSGIIPQIMSWWLIYTFLPIHYSLMLQFSAVLSELLTHILNKPIRRVVVVVVAVVIIIIKNPKNIVCFRYIIVNTFHTGE